MDDNAANPPPPAQPNDGDELDPRVWTQLPPLRDRWVYRYIRDARRITPVRMHLVGGMRYRTNLGPGLGYAIQVERWMTVEIFLTIFAPPPPRGRQPRIRGWGC